MRADPVTEQNLEDLMAAKGRLLLSIYVPTHQRGAESVTQDPIRLGNQLGEADDRLERAGVKPRGRSDRLARANELLGDRDFWEHQGRGLGVFIDDQGKIVVTLLRRKPATLVVVAPTFHLRPLFAEVDPMTMQVLVLTKGAVRLLEATEESIEVVAADLPASLEDVNWFVDRETQRQQHPGAGGRDQNRHGHDPRDKEAHDLERFLRAVDDSLETPEPGPPLIVLGSERVVAGYRATTERETIVPRNGGVSRVDSLAEIHQRVVPVIEERASLRQRETVSRVAKAQSANRVIDELHKAIWAAAEGRIDEIVIKDSSPPVWGHIEQTEGKIGVRAEETAEATDLLDRLLVMARRTGAEVSVVDDADFPSDFMAVLRY